jgi:alcohol dehydrogenase class IV
MRGEWRFNTAGQIIFGRGTARRTGEVVCELGARRACIITDEGLVGAGLHAVLLQALADAGVETGLYDGGQAKPTLESVAVCAATLKDKGYEALVALGGGSNIDLAKAVAVLLRHGGAAED